MHYQALKRHGGNLNFFFFFWPYRVGSLFPNQGSNPCPLHWEHTALTTGPLGKSLKCISLVERIQSEKATYCMIPTVRNSENLRRL